MIRITRISVCIWDMMVCDVYRPTPQFSYSLTLFPDSQRFSRLCWRKIALWSSSFSGNRRGKAPSERNHRRLPRCHNELCQLGILCTKHLNNCGVSKYWVEENWLNIWMTFRELAYFILEGFINRTRTLVFHQQLRFRGRPYPREMVWKSQEMPGGEISNKFLVCFPQVSPKSPLGKYRADS
jgi:hypothetical protein